MIKNVSINIYPSFTTIVLKLLKSYDKCKEFLLMLSFYSKKSGPTRGLVLLEMHNTKMVINGVLLTLS